MSMLYHGYIYYIFQTKSTAVAWVITGHGINNRESNHCYTCFCKRNVCDKLLFAIMPIIVKDYVWSQNEESVFVHLSLRGVHPSKVDIFTCDNYIKVNFEKYLCEIFLHQNVIDSESKCLLDDKDVSFELRKEIPEEWSALEADIPKSEKLKLKEEIIKNRMIKEEELKKEKTKRKQEIKSSATQSQIWEDGQLRQQIDLLRKKQQDEFFKDSENPTVEEISEEEEMPIVIKKKKKKKKKIPPNFEGFWPPAPMVDTSKVKTPHTYSIAS